MFDNSDSLAFSTASGNIWISQRLIGLVRSDDQLAFVIGHEMGHLMARHVGESITRCVIDAGVGQLRIVCRACVAAIFLTMLRPARSKITSVPKHPRKPASTLPADHSLSTFKHAM